MVWGALALLRLPLVFLLLERGDSSSSNAAEWSDKDRFVVEFSEQSTAEERSLALRQIQDDGYACWLDPSTFSKAVCIQVCVMIAAVVNNYAVSCNLCLRRECTAMRYKLARRMDDFAQVRGKGPYAKWSRFCYLYHMYDRWRKYTAYIPLPSISHTIAGSSSNAPSNNPPASSTRSVRYSKHSCIIKSRTTIRRTRFRRLRQNFDVSFSG